MGDPVTLRDGSRISLRPIRPDDKDAIALGFDRLSPQSRYRRFFAPLQRLSSTDLRYLTEVDHHDHEAIIATGTDGEPAGVARYVRAEEPSYAEVAVTVVDHWQGLGVATALLQRLVARAREEGIEYFLALVLSDNAEALELFESLSAGAVKPRRSASGHVELTIELPAPEEVSGSALGRALRSAARGGVRITPWRVLKRAAARSRGR